MTATTLEKVCADIHNYFTDGVTPIEGEFTVDGGTIALEGVKEGQYFRVEGSDLNDGVYQYPPTDMIEETFEGVVTPMRVPRAVLAIAQEVEDWEAQYGATMRSPMSSESVIGVYSYSKATASNGTGATADADAWSSAFRARLDPWRKLR